ncbi:hypothetical protein H0X10_01640 [Candidatus Saccharibacteria bacterium]|nr:hypothetical protein [Candidatus Saccharibacteria bacterium]
MRQEYIEYALLEEVEREMVTLPSLDATVDELQVFWSSLDTVRAARGEQPDSLALTNAGALRGDVPFSSGNQEETK